MMEGVIVRGRGGFYTVRDSQGQEYVLRAKKKFRRQRITPLVGDRVYFTPGEAEAEWYQAENHAGIRAILEESGCVEAVFQAHLHEFRSLSLNGIRYVTVPSPERSPEYSADDFPIVEILESGFLYNGEKLP